VTQLPPTQYLGQPTLSSGQPSNVLPPPSPAYSGPLPPPRPLNQNTIQPPMPYPHTSGPINGPVLPQMSSPQPHLAPIPQHATPLVPYSSGCTSCGPTTTIYDGGFGECTAACCGRRGCYVGGGFYYVKPHWEENPAYVILNLGGDTIVDFDWDYELAPRLFAGINMGDGMGVRARYWRFRHEPDPLDFFFLDGDEFFTAFPLNLDASPLFLLEDVVVTEADYLFNSRLHLDVYDLEGTLETQWCGCTVLFSGGARYVEMKQRYRARGAGLTLDADDNTGVFAVDLDSFHTFRGIGPTASVEVRYPLGGRCGTGCSSFNVYGAGRGSVLFGTGKQSVNRLLVYANLETQETTVQEDAAFRDRDDILPVLELELGVEYAGYFGCHRVFLQAAAVGQTWFGAGNAANVNEFLLPSTNTNLGFFGVTVAGGVEF